MSVPEAEIAVRVNVLLFSVLREEVGEPTLSLDVPPGCTGGALLDRLALEHPAIPANANVRLKRVHGDGKGELVIDFDRLVPRRSLFVVESRSEMSVTDGEEEQELSVGRKHRFEMERE